MKEQEIRDRIKGFIDAVDRGVKKVVMPAALGVGLALSGGCGGDLMDAPQPTASQQAGKGEWGGPVALYAAPFPTPDSGVVLDSGEPVEPDSGMVALYAAPFPTPDAGVVLDSGEPVEPDSGMVALYAAPFPEPDTGVTEDSSTDDDMGPVALYAAPFPDDDQQPS